MPTNPVPKVLRRTQDRLRLADPRRMRRRSGLGPDRDGPEFPRDLGDDGSAGVREPRRPNPRPPALATAADPPRSAQFLDLVAV